MEEKFMKDDPSKEPTPRTEQNGDGVPFSVVGKRLTRRDFMLLSGMSAASLLLAGCGGGGGGKAAIITSQGGRVQCVDDPNASMTFPAGMVNSDTTVIMKTTSPVTSLGEVFNVANEPTYEINFNAPGSRVSHLHITRSAVSTAITMSCPNPQQLNNQNGIVYLLRPDIGLPYFQGSVFDPANHLVKTTINPDVLKIFDQNNQINTNYPDIPVVEKIMIGVAKYNQGPTIKGNAWLKTFHFNRSSVSGQSGYWTEDTNGWTATTINGERIAIVVPGTWGKVSDDTSTHLSDWLVNLGFVSDTDQVHFFNRVLGVNYETLKATPDQNGELLGAQIKMLIDQGASIYVFAHSQGGLVARWALERAGAQDARMLVMFGTPNRGIPWAVALAANEACLAMENAKIGLNDLWNFIKLNTNIQPLVDVYPALFAMSYWDMPKIYSSFLTTLNDGTHQSNAVYYTVSGHISDISQIKSDTMEYFTHYVLSIGSPNDGIVYETSAWGQDGAGHDLGSFTTAGYKGNKSVNFPHSFLPQIGQIDPSVGQTVGGWIRTAANGMVDVSVRSALIDSGGK
jgi:hypothetical protein